MKSRTCDPHLPDHSNINGQQCICHSTVSTKNGDKEKENLLHLKTFRNAFTIGLS